VNTLNQLENKGLRKGGMKMSKPFQPELAKKEKETRKRLVNKLNGIFKRLRATPGPGKNTDIEVYDPQDPSFKIQLEMEAARPDRWDKIKSGEYKTVRRPLAKKEKYKDSRFAIDMVTVRDDTNVSDILAVDYETWVRNGHLETAPYVKAGEKGFAYRKEGGEPFWAIEREKVHWGYDGLEDYLISCYNKWKESRSKEISSTG
jgi:hypothetical protein